MCTHTDQPCHGIGTGRSASWTAVAGQTDVGGWAQRQARCHGNIEGLNINAIAVDHTHNIRKSEHVSTKDYCKTITVSVPLMLAILAFL